MIEQLETIDLNLGTSHFESLQPNERKYLKFDVTATSAFILKYETNGACTVSDDPYKLGAVSRYTEAEEFVCPPGSDYDVYLLSPGTYYMDVESNEADDVCSFNITAELVPAETNGINKVAIDEDTEMVQDDMTILEFDHFSEINEAGQFYIL